MRGNVSYFDIRRFTGIEGFGFLFFSGKCDAFTFELGASS
jgi:hypothetical protein